MLMDLIMLNVAFELSTIGLGSSEDEGGKNRAGLFRFNTEMVRFLFERDDIKAHVFFGEYPHVYRCGYNYLKYTGLKFDTVFENTPSETKVYEIINRIGSKDIRPKIARNVSRFIKLLKSPRIPQNIDIFHSFYYPLPKYIKPLQNIRFRTIHDLTPLLFPKMFLEGHRRKFIKGLNQITPQYDWFFTVSRHTKNDLCKILKISEERVFVTPLAACPKNFYPIGDNQKISRVKQHLKIPDQPYFLSLATLEPRKNLKIALTAFKEFVQEQNPKPDILFVLVGRKGWLIDQLINTVKSDPVLKKRIILPGFVPDKMLAPLLSGAIAFVYPSLYEGFGLPVLEAMQCGAPVITTNRSSLPEVVGKAAVTVDGLNVTELAEALFKLSADRPYRQVLSKRSIDRAKQFSWERSAEETIRGYKIAMQRKFAHI
jgi:glycosyltransferase involved in cell wall biosynthesis